MRKAIRLRNAVALYTSSVLGSGVLVLPGITARIAGPGSIVAWVLLSLASFPFAITFASLSARRPESGGVYSFAKEAFGIPVATLTGWLFALWEITGAPAVALVASSYLGYVFQLSRLEIFIAGFLVLLAAIAVNYFGITLSNKVQLAVIISIVVMLLAAIVSSSFLVKASNFTPFFPNGIAPVGTSAALIFWSFLGYENVSNVAGEFENPERDFRRSVTLSVLLVSAIYVSVAVVTVGTLAYRNGGSVATFAAILSNALGEYAGLATAILAVFIIFGLINAYTTGMSRVFYTSAQDGGFPRFMNHLNSRRQVPDRVLAAMLLSTIPVFSFYYFAGIDLETAFLVSGGAAILIYVVGFAAAIRISGKDRTILGKWMPFVSLAISLVVLVFVGAPLIVSLLVAAASLGYAFIQRSRSKQGSRAEA